MRGGLVVMEFVILNKWFSQNIGPPSHVAAQMVVGPIQPIVFYTTFA